MMTNLTAVRADDFLRAWWTSRYGRIQKAQLFPKFRTTVQTVADVSRTATDMLRTSEQYAALEVADDPLWAPYTDATRDHIRALKTLGGTQAHPVMLAGLAKFEPRELERLFRLLEVLIVRYQ